MGNHSAAIGVENLVYAILTDETIPTYGPVIPISPLINVKITPKITGDTLYADNQAVERVTTMGDVDVEVETQDLPLEILNGLLGHALDSVKGVLTHAITDIAPYVALGFKISKGNQKYRYVWLLKGKFEELPDDQATQEDKAKFSTPKLKGTFMPRADGDWKYTADDDSGTVPAGFLSTVYNAVLDLAAPTVTTVPADAATGVLGTAPVVFTFSKAIQPGGVIPANIFLMKADGTPVPVTLSIGAGNTVVTLAPGATLGAGAYIAVATTNIKSNAGVPIAANCIVNFTV